MYLNSDLHINKYLVNYGSNYVILSSNKAIYGESGDKDSINAILHYFQPSEYDIPITYSSYETIQFDDISSLYTDSIFDRADFPLIFLVSFDLFIICVFIINQLTKIFKKGGVFGSL